MSIEFNSSVTPISRESIHGDSSQKKVDRDSSAASPRENSTATDTITLTSTATRLQGLGDTIAEYPVVDSQRVNSVKKALEQGTYQVDVRRLADNIIMFETGMIGDGNK